MSRYSFEEQNNSLAEESDFARAPSIEVVRQYHEESQRISLENERRNAGVQTTKGSKEDDLKAEVQLDEHKIPLDELLARYNSSLEEGLSSEQHRIAYDRDGPNRLSPPLVTPSLVKFLAQLFGGFSLLLWVGAILCFLGYFLNPDDPSNLYLGVVLVVVIVATAIFSHYQESKAAKVMDKFQGGAAQNATVLRDGKKVEVDATTLVVGDIVELEGGKKVPADIRIIESASIKVDNSSLTGESEPQSRVPDCTDENPLETKNLAFYTTSVLEGSGLGVVINTGDRTVIGRIAGLAASTENSSTLIHKEINDFIKFITILALTLGVIFFILGFTVFDLISNLVFIIGIIVANVPEGLLPTVTVALTLTAKRMSKKKVRVKNLESIETLGATKTICSDKTGTLTQNRMTVAHLWVDGHIYETETPLTNANYDPSSDAFQALYNNAALCNTAVFKSEDDSDLPPGERVTNGNASDVAFLKFCQLSSDVAKLRRDNAKVFEIPFNSTNKYTISVHRLEGQQNLRLFMKGAPERVLKRCSHILINGNVEPLDDHWVNNYNQAYEELGSKGERVLGFAQLELPANEYPPDYAFDADLENFPTEGLVFLGVMALIDPPRPSVPAAVLTCVDAGIKVVMVTGDHPITAKAIARQVNIIRDDGLTADDYADQSGVEPWTVSAENAQSKSIVIRGDQLINMSEDDLDVILEYDQIVFARTSPQQKYRIVAGFQRRGDIVAVTGDGVNDSPALKRADLGIAMGITGSEVSQESADMILLDDNFSSIVKGIEEGRLIFDNLKKSICYTLMSNVPEITPFAVFIILRVPPPLVTILLLIIDLGTDLLPSISLAYEKSESNIMKRAPRNPLTDRLVTAKLLFLAYPIYGVISGFAAMYCYFVVFGDMGYSPFELIGASDRFQIVGGDRSPWTIDSGTYTHAQRINAMQNAQTAYFAGAVLCKWANLIICKTRQRSIIYQGLRNQALNGALIIVSIACLLIIYVPFLNIIFSTVPMHPKHFLPVMPFLYFIIFLDELRKAWIRAFPFGYVKKFTYY